MGRPPKGKNLGLQQKQQRQGIRDVKMADRDTEKKRMKENKNLGLPQKEQQQRIRDVKKTDSDAEKKKKKMMMMENENLGLQEKLQQQQQIRDMEMTDRSTEKKKTMKEKEKNRPSSKKEHQATEPGTTYGLFCLVRYENGELSPFNFLHFDRTTAKLCLDGTTDLFSGLDLSVHSSCHDLVLCRKDAVKSSHPDYYSFFVGNIISEDISPLPPPPTCPAKFAVGLARDLSRPGYSLVCVSQTPATDHTPVSVLEVQVFSSESGSWRLCEETLQIPTLSSMPCVKVFGDSSPCYFQGALHWLFAAKEIEDAPLYLLRYHVNENQYQFSPVPEKPYTYLYKAFLAEHRGRLHYCASLTLGVRVWANLGHSSDDGSLSWTLKYEVPSRVLKKYIRFLCEKVPEVASTVESFPDDTIHRIVRPLALHASMPIVLLHVPGWVISYNFSSKEFQLVLMARGPKLMSSALAFSYKYRHAEY